MSVPFLNFNFIFADIASGGKASLGHLVPNRIENTNQYSRHLHERHYKDFYVISVDLFYPDIPSLTTFKAIIFGEWKGIDLGPWPIKSALLFEPV